jgi:hypothetical protein
MHKFIAPLFAAGLFAYYSMQLCSAASAATQFQSAVVPFTFEDNRILVKCTIDGQGPFDFVVDTGSSDLTVDRALAHRLGLPGRNAGNVGGAGSHTVVASSAIVASLDVGSAHAENLEATILDLSQIREGIGLPRLDGIIGYSMLRHYAVEVDMDRQMLTLSRERLELPPAAHAIPFTLTYDLPFVQARIAGQPGTVLVDTGDRSSLTLFGPFAAKHQMYGRFGGVQDVLTGFGIGGPVYGDVFSLPQLGILGATLTNVTTRASRQSGGAFASTAAAASIGGGVLRRFNVVYDYPRLTMYVWNSADFDVPDGYDRAGMWIAARGDQVYVAGLLPGGPAAKAGLQENDEIVAVSGQPVGAQDILSLRKLFSSSPPLMRISIVSESHGVRTSHEIVLEQLV